MHHSNVSVFAVLLSVAVVAVSGCGETSSDTPVTEKPAPESASQEAHVTADDVERPANYGEAVKRISAYRDAIRDEIAAGRPGKAHGPLDEAVFVLEWTPELARDSGVPKANWEAVNTAAQQIRSLLDEVHTRIDNQEDPDFDAVGDGIQKAIDTLAGISGDKTEEENAVVPNEGSDQ